MSLKRKEKMLFWAKNAVFAYKTKSIYIEYGSNNEYISFCVFYGSCPVAGLAELWKDLEIP